MVKPNIESDADRSSVRTTVTLPKKDLAELGKIAEKKKVSVAWVVREAVEKYLAQQSPLFQQ